MGGRAVLSLLSCIFAYCSQPCQPYDLQYGIRSFRTAPHSLAIVCIVALFHVQSSILTHIPVASMFTQLTLNFQGLLHQLPHIASNTMASYGTFWWVTPLQCLTTISAAVNFGKCLYQDFDDAHILTWCSLSRRIWISNTNHHACST